jgi:hypothetical protein
VTPILRPNAGWTTDVRSSKVCVDARDRIRGRDFPAPRVGDVPAAVPEKRNKQTTIHLNVRFILFESRQAGPPGFTSLFRLYRRGRSFNETHLKTNAAGVVLTVLFPTVAQIMNRPPATNPDEQVTFREPARGEAVRILVWYPVEQQAGRAFMCR